MSIERRVDKADGTLPKVQPRIIDSRNDRSENR